MAPTSTYFDSQTWYRPDDPAVRFIGSKSTLAHWRSAGKGPQFKKVGGGKGSRVIYSGRVPGRGVGVVGASVSCG